MLGDCKNEKTLRLNLEKWRSLGDRVLVHTINDKYDRTSLLFRQNANDVLRQWDVLSTSLVDLKKCRKRLREAREERLYTWETVRVDTGLWFELGLVLNVPPQNILGTHSHDVWFPNLAGQKTGQKTNTYALADAILSGRGKSGGRSHWPVTEKHSYNRVETPNYILQRTMEGQHNEILVICKPNINTYSGFLPTEEITVKNIIVARKKITGHGFFSLQDDAELKRRVNVLRKLNPGAKVIDLS